MRLYERENVMKGIRLVVASNALICLVGCASPTRIAVSEAVGPAPTEQALPAGQSSLEVYSARVRRAYNPNQEEFLMNNDFGTNDFLYRPAHSDYAIYSQDGKLLQQVRNSRGPNDPEPAIVPLAPGRYKITAKARGYGLVTVPVVIRSGKLTTVNLQRNRNLAGSSVPGTDLVVLGDSRVVGWKATAATAAESQ